MSEKMPDPNRGIPNGTEVDIVYYSRAVRSGIRRGLSTRWLRKKRPPWKSSDRGD